MGVKNKIAALALAALSILVLTAQTKGSQDDERVHLQKAKSLQLMEIDGVSYRKVVDATFLHNGTYVICDTALWNVDAKVINAKGHVQVIQDETVLTSDKLDYLIDEDLAQFRGTVVQLRNKKKNILRTRYLDYNTRDSMAVFKRGGSMRDQDGQVIESDEGTYDSQRKHFTFERNVNMFTDTTYVKTSSLDYDSDANIAYFNTYIDFWRDGDMLSADHGWYNRPEEKFFFTGAVHGLSENQEMWCDSMYFWRPLNDVMLLGNAQIQDTTRDVAGLADYVFYCDSLSQITMMRNAAVAMKTEQENHKIDTMYFGADSIVYRTRMMFEIPEGYVTTAEGRVKDMFVDPVAELRARAAKEAAEAAAAAAEADPNRAHKKPEVSQDEESSSGNDAGKGKGRRGRKTDAAPEEEAPAAPATPPAEPEQPAAPEPPAPPVDSVSAAPVAADSTASEPQEPEEPVDPVLAARLKAEADSLAAVALREKAIKDSIAVADSIARIPKDSTKVGFLTAVGKVAIFRTDMQVRCDSMAYTDLDSIARFYRDPIVWNEGRRQYTSDSLYTLIRNGAMERASLLSDAFIITQEDSLYFDQIKGAEVMAYFDTTSALRRFDALGGATAIFYLMENDVFATVNKVESKMLSALLSDGELEKVHYFEAPKNNAYPIVQMKKEEHRMKGFNWQPELRPQGRYDITPLRVRPSERRKYLAHPKTTFKQTEIYFPGYMKQVEKDIAASKARKREAERRRKAAEAARADSLAMAEAQFKLDSIARADSLAIADSLFRVDSLMRADSILRAAAIADSLAAIAPPAQPEQPAVAPPQTQQADSTVAPAPVTQPADSISAAAPPVAAADTIKAPPVVLTPAQQDSLHRVELARQKAEQERLKQLEIQKKKAEQERQRKLRQEERKRKLEEAAAKRQARIDEREARWAVLDSLDALKAQEESLKALSKQREAKRKAVILRMKQDKRDETKLQKYIQMYEKRKAREEAREASRSKKRKKTSNQITDERPETDSSGEFTPEVAPGRKLPPVVER